MNNFFFCSPTKYIFGRDVENEAGRRIADEGGKKALIVIGGGSVVRSGLLDRVTKSLDEAGIAHTLLSGIQPNPVDTKVYEGIRQARAEKCDFILAVGGGSVIDTSKAIAAGVPYDGDFWDFFMGKPVEKALPVGVVLTIPAAGSEGSGNTVITRLDGLHKISIRSPYLLRPKFALMNPELTYTLPFSQTAAGVADMMSHIFERYFSQTEGVEITDRLCEGALKAIMAEALKIKANPTDYDARANIMWSGTVAHNGVLGVGRQEDWASHGLEHELSAVYGVTHGAGLAVIFPAWMTFMADCQSQRGAQLARRVFDIVDDDDRSAALKGIERLKAFYRKMQLPTTLAELGIPEPDIDLLVKKVHENKGTPFGFYRPLFPADSRKIYELAR
ncbi:MAG: iron-containing alcohol dehydrogenase [Muribaculaceae bacterium]|nr:iron-containing alcohol dehydrogenase [Muribaculaceae bacterium]MBP5315498.1 iron-containing alcohol dehydrogenase [Muribaculaceae bacterium]